MFDRQYVRESVIWIAICIAGVEGVKFFEGLFPPDSAYRFLAILPVVIGLGIGLWVELRQVARMDELQKQIYLAATLTGSMTMMMVCSVAYIGEALKLWARMAPIYAVLALGAGFALGLIVAKRRYA